MNELIAKIEQWAEDRNIIKGTKPIDQAMKLFSEFGELADNVGKGRDCRDDIGDVFVVLVNLAKQVGKSLTDLNFESLQWAEGDNKELVLVLSNTLSELVGYAHNANFFHIGLFKRAINTLNAIACNNKTTLEQCVQIAYNDIKDRKGIVYNGLFIKESDPAYQDALDNIEADKRLATQKRISVNIEDL